MNHLVHQAISPSSAPFNTPWRWRYLLGFAINLVGAVILLDTVFRALPIA
jgi:hypothetical protein